MKSKQFLALKDTTIISKNWNALNVLQNFLIVLNVHQLESTVLSVPLEKAEKLLLLMESNILFNFYTILDVWYLVNQASTQTLKHLNLSYVYLACPIASNVLVQQHVKSVSSLLINGVMWIINVKALVKKDNTMIQINNLVLIAKYNIALCVMVQVSNAMNVLVVMSLFKVIQKIMFAKR